MGTAWARHAMCESAFTDRQTRFIISSRNVILIIAVNYDEACD
jgi:hypothetical protein